MKNNLECINFEKEVGLEELLHVDLSVKNMDSEEAEFIWDLFPKISMDKRNIEKFSHMTDLGYKVQNICKKCHQEALKKFGGLP